MLGSRGLILGIVIGLAGGMLPGASQGADDAWPQFRGPDGQGRAPVGKIPARWSETENVRWKTAIPGKGWSSPVIENGVCWLTTAVIKEATAKQKQQVLRDKLANSPLANEMEIIDSVALRAVAVDLKSGKLLHDVLLFQYRDPEPVHSLNSYASPTPVLKEGRLYCHFGNMGTACVDTQQAQVLWKTRLATEHSVGPGSSPVLYDKLLIIPCDGTEAQSVVALDASNGEPVWKTKRPPMTGSMGDFHKAFSTPLIIQEETGDQVVVPGAQWVVSYNPHTGEPLWQVRHGEGFSNAPCPVYSQGTVFICTGYMTPELLAIRIDGHGDVTDTHVTWRLKKQVPAMPSPVLVDRVVYIVSDQGVVTCADAASGEVRFQKRVGGNYSASPLVADSKLLFANRDGEVTVVQASATWQELGKNRVDGELMSSPAVWNDSLILRTGTHLYRISERR
ncbi:MAG: PQQ-binding-like beta-propeller repeat protein [Planctomycetales bacterium]